MAFDKEKLLFTLERFDDKPDQFFRQLELMVESEVGDEEERDECMKMIDRMRRLYHIGNQYEKGELD